MFCSFCKTLGDQWVGCVNMDAPASNMVGWARTK